MSFRVERSAEVWRTLGEVPMPWPGHSHRAGAQRLRTHDLRGNFSYDQCTVCEPVLSSPPPSKQTRQNAGIRDCQTQVTGLGIYFQQLMISMRSKETAVL